MPFLLKYTGYDMYIGKIEYDEHGRCSCYCANADEESAQRFKTRKAALKFSAEHESDDLEVIYEKPVPKNRPFTYRVLMEQADKMYKRIAVHSPFCAECDVRDFIAKNVDRCVDVERNKKALAVREWSEYKKYAPMKKADYDSQKKWIKEQYKKQLKLLETKWNTQGKNNPNFHKI